MITKKQYLEILDTLEKYLKLQEDNKIVMSKDYQFGFMAAIDIVKSLVKELQ